jgi:hypothetical protein
MQIEVILSEKKLQIFRTPNFQQLPLMIKSCDADKDLSWWSDTYGATMKMNWPIFEVFSFVLLLFINASS